MGPFLATVIVAVALTAWQVRVDRSVFERFFGALDPIGVMIGIAVVGVISMAYLQGTSDFAVLGPGAWRDRDSRDADRVRRELLADRDPGRTHRVHRAGGVRHINQYVRLQRRPPHGVRGGPGVDLLAVRIHVDARIPARLLLPVARGLGRRPTQVARLSAMEFVQATKSHALAIAVFGIEAIEHVTQSETLGARIG